MLKLVVFLFIVLIVVAGWYAFGTPARARTRRVIERPAARRVVRRRTTIIDEEPDVIEERRITD